MVTFFKYNFFHWYQVHGYRVLFVLHIAIASKISTAIENISITTLIFIGAI